MGDRADARRRRRHGALVGSGMATFGVTRVGTILAVADVDRSVAFYTRPARLRRRRPLRRPALRHADPRRRPALARRAGPSGARPTRGDDGRAATTDSRLPVVLVLEVADARAIHAALVGGGRAPPRRAVRAALGRPALLRRRSRRLPRRDRAAGVRPAMKAVVLAGVGDLRLEEVPDAAHRRRRATPSSRVTTTGLCGADLFPFHGHTPGLRGRHDPRPRVRRRRRGGRAGGRRACAPGDRVVSTSTISLRRMRALPRRPRLAVPGAGAVRLLGRLPAPRRRAGRAGPGALRGARPLPGARRRVRRGRRLRGRHAADRLQRGAARRGSSVGDVVGRASAAARSGSWPSSSRRASRARSSPSTASPRGARSPSGFGARGRRHRTEAAAAIAAASGGIGADVVIEAAGSPAALQAALRLVRGLGTVSVVGAHFEPDFPLDNGLHVRDGDDAARVRGATASTTASASSPCSRRRDRPVPGVTHRFPLAEAREAYRVFDAREAVKVLLRP